MGKTDARRAQSVTRNPKTPYTIHRISYTRQHFRLLTSCKYVSFCSSIGCSFGSGSMASVPYCYRPMRHDKLTSLDERELNFRSGECRPIDTGADTAESTSTSAPTATHMNGRIRPRFIYLYLHVFPLRALPASWFSSFLGIRNEKTYKHFLTKPLPWQGITLPPSSFILSATAACNSIQHLFAISAVN